MKEWSYHIIDPAGQVYQIENGIVVARGNYKSMANTPIGWQDISLIWERSTDKFGLTRAFSLPLGFVVEGQSILTYLNWTKNFEQQVNLLINRKKLYIDTTQFYFWYKFFYKGELDFSTYNYDDENAKANVNIMEGGLSKLLNADWDTLYEIPLTDPKYIKADGINLHKAVTYTIPAPDADNPAGITVSNNVFSEFAIPTAQINIDGSAAGVFLQDQIFEPVASHFTYLTDSVNYILKIEDDFFKPVTVNIVGTIKVKCLVELPTGGELQIRILKQDGTAFETGDPNPVGRLLRTPVGNMTTGTDYSFDFDVTGILQPGDRIFFIGFLFTTVTGAVEVSVQFSEGTEFSINFATQQATTYPPALDLITLYKRIGAKISGSEADWTSDLLTARPDILVASGDSLRGITDPVIKISMHQFFNSVNVILNAGIGVEAEKCVLETKAHFFQTDNPIPLGQVKQYKDKWATDYIYNTLKIGYPDVNLENVNGRFAFNTSYLYSSPVKRVVKQLTLVSDIRADPFEIEIARITGNNSTDNIHDNINYFIQVSDVTELNSSGLTVYLLYRPAWTITGVPDPATIFNVGLSIRRLIEVHRNWLAGVFAGFDTEELKFETTQYNRDLVANGIDEDANISIQSLGTPLFKPVNFDFQSPFLAVGDLAMSLVDVFSDTSDWIVTGDGDPTDTSDPRTGTTDIKVTAATFPSVVFTLPSGSMPFSALNDINFYLKLSASLSPLAILNVAFYKGATLARSANAIFVTNSLAYQNIILAGSALSVNDPTVEDFDTIVISMPIIVPVTFVLDDVTLSIDPQNDLTNIMDDNPNRCFSFIHPNGKLLKGHSIKVGAAPNTEREQGFLLLATGDTNLEDLII